MPLRDNTTITNVLSEARRSAKTGLPTYYVPGSGVYGSQEEKDIQVAAAEKEFGRGNVYDMGEVLQKPSDGELEVFEQWQKFAPEAERFAKQNLGLNPNTPTNALLEQVFNEAKTKRIQTYNKNLDVADMALLTPAQRIKIDQDADAYGASERDRLQKRLDQEMSIARSVFEKQISMQQSESKLKREDVDIPVLVEAIVSGQDSPISIKGSRGAIKALQAKEGVLKRFPKFNFMMSDANYKWKQSATNQRTINFVSGALPRLGALDDQLKKMPNVNINTINRVMATVSKEFGRPEYTNFESNRNAIVQEINTALSGTSQGSDMRIKIELENLQSARSPEQIRGAIENLRLALEARLDVDLNPLYPIEVVRGEKSMSQYKRELFASYRGNYSPHFGQEKSGPEVGEEKQGYRFKGGNPADRNNWEKI